MKIRVININYPILAKQLHIKTIEIQRVLRKPAELALINRNINRLFHEEIHWNIRSHGLGRITIKSHVLDIQVVVFYEDGPTKVPEIVLESWVYYRGEKLWVFGISGGLVQLDGPSEGWVAVQEIGGDKGEIAAGEEYNRAL